MRVDVAGGHVVPVDAGGLHELGLDPEDPARPALVDHDLVVRRRSRSRCSCRTTGSWRWRRRSRASRSSTKSSDAPGEPGARRALALGPALRARRLGGARRLERLVARTRGGDAAGIAVVNPARSSSSDRPGAPESRPDGSPASAADAASATPPSSTTSTTTTVMLSRPPPSLARRTSSSAASVGSSRRRSTLLIWSAPTSLNRPSEQSRKRSPRDGIDRPQVDVDRLVDAEHPRDDVALRVDLGLLGGDAPLAHEVGDDAVVLGELRERAVAEEVRRGCRRRWR